MSRRRFLNRERLFAVNFTRAFAAVCFGVATGQLAVPNVDRAVPLIALGVVGVSYAGRWQELHNRAQLAQETTHMAYEAMYVGGRALKELVSAGSYEQAIEVADQQAHIAEVFLRKAGATDGDG